MGTTLENGTYLPNEGERNCYQGLASNWQAVDTNIGYVSALRQAIAGALTRQIVTQLPTEDIDPNCIYMILKATAQTSNIYDEYMYINSSWELIGDSQLDLSNYYTKQEVNQLPAVASGVTSTKVGNYDTHIANGDIHVTASDKAKWTNSANTNVLRLAKSALTPSTSDNSFSNLDDSTALKVGDKVIDPNGVLYEVTAVDSTNEQFTIGTALDAFAKNSNVVHNSGNENINGTKDFADFLRIYNSVVSGSVAELSLVNQKVIRGGQDSGEQAIYFKDRTQSLLSGILTRIDSNGNTSIRLLCYNKDSSDSVINNYLGITLKRDGSFVIAPSTNNTAEIGSNNYRNANIYSNKINNLEPSSLSLPSGNASDVIDISSYLTILDGSSANTYVAPANGWISITMSNCTGVQAYINGLWGNQIVRPTAGGVRFLIPILKNLTANILIFGGTVDNARLIPCQGNV